MPIPTLNQTSEYLSKLRRDCLEITGIPVISLNNPSSFVGKLSSALVRSTAHRPPATKKVKERIIVKFLRRDKRNEIYKQRSKLYSLIPQRPSSW